MANYMKELTEVLKKDKQMRQAWQANIAMAYKDEWAQYSKKVNKGKKVSKVMNAEDRHIIANNAADNFLKQLCEVLKWDGGK